jgi:hypothetical protein
MKTLRSLRAVLLGAAAASVVAVAPLAAQAGDPAAGRSDSRPQQRRARNRLTAEELTEGNFGNVFQAVEVLRPNWFRVRGNSSMSRPEMIRVYIDGTPRGSVASLRQVPVTSVQSIEYLSGTQATQRFGTDHNLGAILVTSR